MSTLLTLRVSLNVPSVFIFIVLIWLSKRKIFDGQIIWSYGILYSMGRFLIEYFRGDDRGFAVEEFLSTSQFVGILIFVLSALMFFKLFRNNLSKNRAS